MVGFALPRGDVLPLPIREACLVGRSDEVDLVLASPAVARRHAVVMAWHDGVFLADLGSTNGTFVRRHERNQHLGAVGIRPAGGSGDYSYGQWRPAHLVSGAHTTDGFMKVAVCDRLLPRDTVCFSGLFEFEVV